MFPLPIGIVIAIITPLSMQYVFLSFCFYFSLYQGNKFDIFLSYKHETVSIECAKVVYERLTSLGFKVYLDENQQYGGVHIGKQLTAAISEAPIFLPILSSQYMTKGGELWCKRELNFAKYKERELLPVVMKGIQIPDDVMLTIGPQTVHLEYDPLNPSIGIEKIVVAVDRLFVKLSGMTLTYTVKPWCESHTKLHAHHGCANI